MNTFEWTITGVNEELAQFTVTYKMGDREITLCLPLTDTGKTIEQVIETYFPSHLFEEKKLMSVQPGMSGVASAKTRVSELPTMYGSWAEEDIRAMIYDVIQQTKQEEV